MWIPSLKKHQKQYSQLPISPLIQSKIIKQYIISLFSCATKKKTLIFITLVPPMEYFPLIISFPFFLPFETWEVQHSEIFNIWAPIPKPQEKTGNKRESRKKKKKKEERKGQRTQGKILISTKQNQGKVLNRGVNHPVSKLEELASVKFLN